MAPLVSVVLPTHNRGATLSRAIHSVLAQTHSDLELIVVDDGSTDGTADVVSEFNDPRLVSVRLDPRSGVAVARNAGIRRARAALIGFQDSDDEWLPTKLALQLELLERCGPEVGAIGGRWVSNGPDPVQIQAPQLESGRHYEAELLDGRCLITPVWLIRRELLDELGLFDERMACLEDWDLLLRLSQVTAMRAVDETVLIKNGAPDTLGGNAALRAPAMEEILARHGRRFLADPPRHASFCLEVADLYLQRGRFVKALQYAGRSTRRGGAPREALLSFVGVLSHAVAGALKRRLLGRRD